MIKVLYKYTTILEAPPYWCYTEPFPKGWFWVKEERINSEYIEYFEGIESTQKEMLEYLEQKFKEFQKRHKIYYYKILF